MFHDQIVLRNTRNYGLYCIIMHYIIGMRVKVINYRIHTHFHMTADIKIPRNILNYFFYFLPTSLRLPGGRGFAGASGTARTKQWCRQWPRGSRRSPRPCTPWAARGRP